jgi:hypothetical protein
MGEAFNPYHKWLGIPQSEQPANHYRLLGLAPFESDPDVIQSAAVRQTAHVRNFSRGEHSELSQRVLNELAAAQLCLLQQDRKAAYDQVLRSKLAQQTPRPAPTVSASAPRPQGVARDVANRTRETRQANAIEAILADATTAAPLVAVAPRMQGGKGQRAAWQVWILLPGVATAVVVFWFAFTLVKDKLEAQLGAGPAPITQTPPQPAQAPAQAAQAPAQASPPPLDDRPAQAASDSGTIDLLKTINVSQDVRGGSWRRDGDELVSAAGQQSIVDLRSTPSKSYRLKLVVKRTQGEESLMVGLRVGTQRVSALIDGYATIGFRSGLQLVDHQLLGANAAAKRGRLLTNGQRHTIVWTVQPGVVTLELDGREAFRWAGDFNRLSPDGDWWRHGAPGLIVGSWHCEYRVRQIELTPLDD